MVRSYFVIKPLLGRASERSVVTEPYAAVDGCLFMLATAVADRIRADASQAGENGTLATVKSVLSMGAVAEALINELPAAAVEALDIIAWDEEEKLVTVLDAN
jgi:hypothetical protein